MIPSRPACQEIVAAQATAGLGPVVPWKARCRGGGTQIEGMGLMGALTSHDCVNDSRTQWLG